MINYVNDLNELCKIFEDAEEPIVYPVRNEGIIFLDFFRYTNEFYHYDEGYAKFCCITKDAWPERSAFAQRTIQGLPVILLRNLPHFRETGTFFIAAPNEQVEYIYNLMKNFGCRNIFAATDNIIIQMKNKISELKSSGQVTDWYLNYFTKKITALEYRIEEQSEIRETNTKAFAEYRNCYRGKKIVIVACGPTVNFYKPIDDAIHIGINFAWRKENISLDYLFTQDRTGDRGAALKTKGSNFEMEKGFDKIKEKIFIHKRLGIVQALSGLVYPEDVSVRHKNVVRFYSDTDSLGKHLYQDICQHPTMDFASSIFSALHFALFTYPKEIYLVGCDMTATGHFYSKDDKTDLDMPIIKIGYARTKMFAEQNYPETEIISVNPVGLKELFTDIYSDEYRKSLTENDI